MAYHNTADATAVPDDIRNGKTAYARGAKIEGTQGFSVSGTALSCPSDWYVVGTTLYIPDSWLKENGG